MSGERIIVIRDPGRRKQEMSTGESVKQVSQRGADSSVASGFEPGDIV